MYTHTPTPTHTHPHPHNTHSVVLSSGQLSLPPQIFIIFYGEKKNPSILSKGKMLAVKFNFLKLKKTTTVPLYPLYIK